MIWESRAHARGEMDIVIGSPFSSVRGLAIARAMWEGAGVGGGVSGADCVCDDVAAVAYVRVGKADCVRTDDCRGKGILGEIRTAVGAIEAWCIGL